jgi:hypothetical protein
MEHMGRCPMLDIKKALGQVTVRTCMTPNQND